MSENGLASKIKLRKRNGNHNENYASTTYSVTNNDRIHDGKNRSDEEKKNYAHTYNKNVSSDNNTVDGVQLCW